MNMLDFWNAISDALTPAEESAIDAIARRAVRMGIYPDIRWAQMDVKAVHGLCCELRLKDLAKADDLSFIHDMGGIAKHLKRNTNIHLRNGFIPRHATGAPGILAGEAA